ncbi:4-(cytidine 5'-diphospho)-2-C-methyl-D-erythritol kinase [Pukyongiella litopenaei]|uniref:4-diphosphocytidyl-2-C-methyl-D-erythritol kinase n=1 Tax=Pukyongiella litopenaei TaxID=2605946 RepID=A0A2S0MR06_9RHOB|nr:4-(cytidine 5'-diphospho)-2-C-methyl-D-erythritol kinase [Pukyongiella litopenaei]AVO38302.1 4-(cytidine 5'-diphospho)-2-C-methyl-D-erythritol kinase [Pukyongiella litopenaei]
MAPTDTGAPTPARQSEFAPAKINLTLHVTGRRADGYHLLDSLVVFADLGDRVAVAPDTGLSLTVTGPMAGGVPTGPDNLVLRAARLAGVTGAAITLDKHLPAAAGIGGGSSDAAATLRVLRDRLGVAMPAPLALGADVPVCLAARTARMRGIGENVEPVSGLPPLPAVLVNPGVSVATPDVFRRLSRRDGSAMDDIPAFADARACADWLRGQRNDLEAPARALAPGIGTVLTALGDSGAALVRMSGSGATCFGLFTDTATARQAAGQIAAANPGWWVRSTILGAAHHDPADQPIEL